MDQSPTKQHLGCSAMRHVSRMRWMRSGCRRRYGCGIQWVSAHSHQAGLVRWTTSTVEHSSPARARSPSRAVGAVYRFGGSTMWLLGENGASEAGVKQTRTAILELALTRSEQVQPTAPCPYPRTNCCHARPGSMALPPQLLQDHVVSALRCSVLCALC